MQCGSYDIHWGYGIDDNRDIKKMKYCYCDILELPITMIFQNEKHIALNLIATNTLIS